MMPRLVWLGMAASCLLLADGGPKQKIQDTKTEHLDFPSGGLLTLKNSTGDLWVEGWDQPGMTITTTKTTRDDYDAGNRQQGAQVLDRVQIATERHGEELVVTTSYPRHGGFPPFSRGGSDIDVAYRIYVPRNTRLTADHDAGTVFIDGLTGDIHVTARQGLITLRLAEERQYDIDARSKLGSVTSDFPGREQHSRWLVGRSFTNSTSAAAQKLYLRIGYGDIVLLSAQGPRVPPTVLAR